MKTEGMQIKRKAAPGFFHGIAPIFSAEVKRWWGTKRWILQGLLWIGILNGILGMLALVSKVTGGFDLGEADVRQVFGMLAVLSTVGVVITMQNVLVNERENGIAAWILSKPVSRPAYLLGKAAGHAVGIFPLLWLIPGLGIYWQLSRVFLGVWLGPGSFLVAWLIVGLEITFYLSLTLFMGTLSSNRGAVLAVPLALLFGQQLIIGLIPGLVHVMPYSLSAANAGAAALGESLPIPAAVPAVLLWVGVFLGLSIWRIQREEF